MTSALAQGQDFKQIAPKQIPLPPNPPAVAPPPLAAAPVADPNSVIIPVLKGLRLVDHIEKVRPNGVTGAGFLFEGLSLLRAPGAQAKLRPFLGQPVTFGGLQKIRQAIINWYRSHNHAFLDVSFPEQDISSGVLQVLVTEFHLGLVKVQGNKWFSTSLLRGEMHLRRGDPLVTSKLNEDQEWLNQNPFRRVEIIAEPSAVVGDSDLVLQTQDSFPLRAYLGYDNTGTIVTGRNRWQLGVNWGNAFWGDGQLSYQLETSDNFWHNRTAIPGLSRDPTFAAHSLNLQMPLLWHDELQIFGSYQQAVPVLGPSLGLIGINGQASIRYIWRLPNLPHVSHEELQFGYDFKTANNNLQFGGISVSNSETEIDQFPVVYNATIVDKFGLTTIINTFVFSPGNLTNANNDAAFQPQSGHSGTAFAKARYVYDNINLTHATNLPLKMSWVTRFTGQISDSNLLPSEQLGAGGVYSVRGYDERTANGDNGFLISEELYSPSFDLSKILIKGGIRDQTQVLGFWDYGDVSINHPSPGQQSTMKLESVGVGLRYGLQGYITARLDYGWQLLKSPGASTLGEFGHVSITLAY